jgi:hypothetical protein
MQGETVHETIPDHETISDETILDDITTDELVSLIAK